MSRKLIAYVKLMRLHRPVGIVLLLWPTLWALWIAGDGKPKLSVLLIFIVGVIVMRSAGCVINDIADRHLDGFVERTRNRPLVTQELTIAEAWLLFASLCSLALILVLQLNFFTIKIAFIALLITLIYPFTKRVTYLPQLILGIAFACSVLMAFSALINQIPTIGWWLFVVAILWPVAYDTMYAMVDRGDDSKVGIKSTAILFGNYECLIIAGLYSLILIMLISMGWFLHLNFWFYISLVIASSLAAYQLWLISSRKPERCFRAFLNNQWFGGAVFAGMLLSYFFP